VNGGIMETRINLVVLVAAALLLAILSTPSWPG